MIIKKKDYFKIILKFINTYLKKKYIIIFVNIIEWWIKKSFKNAFKKIIYFKDYMIIFKRILHLASIF